MSLLKFIRSEAYRQRCIAGDLPAWLERHPRKEYIVQVTVSTPPWVDRKALQELRDRATRATKLTGEQHVLAHVVPITHPRVCGLTVPWNLKVKHWLVNQREGNRWCEDQLHLFDWPHGTTQDMFPCTQE